MRQFALSSALALFAFAVQALEIEDQAYFGDTSSTQVVRVLSTADISFFEPMISTFLEANPGIAVDYTVASSTEVMRAVQLGEDAFDLAISSAMDLQTKLANDGHVQAYRSAVTQSLPDWAVWNSMLFAFTQEPAAIVVSKAAFGEMDVPSDRNELINLLRQHPERFRGRVGTYDIRQSGLGYLFATQDTRASETYWRLAEVMGGLGLKLYCCSSHMIDAVKSGELLIAYNVLGSYVEGREDKAEFEIILPGDFTTVMLRTAMIPNNATSPELSGAFVDHLMESSHGGNAWLNFFPDQDGPTSDQSLHRIRLGPGLLVFLDQLKRQSFLAEWERAILQN